jgi:hypothetical protein
VIYHDLLKADQGEKKQHYITIISIFWLLRLNCSYIYSAVLRIKYSVTSIYFHLIFWSIVPTWAVKLYICSWMEILDLYTGTQFFQTSITNIIYSFHLPIVNKPEKCIKNRKLDTRVKKWSNSLRIKYSVTSIYFHLIFWSIVPTWAVKLYICSWMEILDLYTELRLCHLAYKLIYMSLAGICFTESKVLHQLHQALKSYLYFFTVLSDLEFNIAAGSLVLNSFKRVSQIYLFSSFKNKIFSY